MSGELPVITIQCDWNEVIRLPNGEAWISSKKLNENSVHDKLKTELNNEGKIKIIFTGNYQYVAHSNLNLIVKHISYDLKVAFIAPTMIHKIHDKSVLSVCIAENALAISSCEQDRLLVWDTRTSEIKLDLKGHGGPVYKCRFFPSGIVVLSAGADGSCRIWSAETGINPVTLKGHKMAVTDVSIVEKGRNVVSVSKDGTAKLWDVGESRCITNVVEGKGQINCCAISKATTSVDVDDEREIGTGDKILVVGCESGLVVCAHIGMRQELFTTQLESPCNSCTLFSDSVIVGCNDGKVLKLGLIDGRIEKLWHESASPVLCLASLTNEMFVVGRQDGTCTVISVNERHALTRVQLTGSDCDGIRDVSFNGKWLVTGCRDSVIRKYDFNQINAQLK